MIDLTMWGSMRPTETDASGALRRRFAFYLFPSYLSDAAGIAQLCDELLDPSGALLGYLRDLAGDKEVVRTRLSYSRMDNPPKDQPTEAKKCLRCGQAVMTDQPTILCDGVVSKVVPFSVHEPVRPSR